MKWRVVFCSVVLWSLLPSVSRAASPEMTDTVRTRYERMQEQRKRIWHQMIPDHSKVQYAGSIGFASMGLGWTYGKKNQWETDIMIGVLPKYRSDKAKAVLTIKETYLPWLLYIRDGEWAVQPLTCSLFFSSVLSQRFWRTEPDYYPSSYYGFSERIRINLSLGQRLMYDIPDVSNWWIQDVSLYYELSACDTDLCTFFGDRTIRIRDILSLAIGIKLHI